MPLKMAPQGEKESNSEAERGREHIVEEKIKLSPFLAKFNRRIGVHSGKGGVGKTFFACNLARVLESEENSVGLLDADVDCPNVPAFLGIRERINIDESGKLVPVKKFGLEIMSTGFMQDDNEPLIIRGPIKHRLLTDFVEKTAWSPLDYLIIDFPPGTSDVPLSAMQFLNLDGIIIVTTPQRESIMDASKATSMARKLGVPIIGLVSNMEGEVFGERGEEIAKKLGVTFLGSIPLSKEIRVANENQEVVLMNESLTSVKENVLDALSKIS